MKTGIRELAWLAVGCVMGAVVVALLTTTALWPVRHSPTPTMSQADATTQRSFDTLLAAIGTNNYEQFVSVADDAFRKGITPAVFRTLSQSLAPRMQAGYTPTYLGQLRQYGAQISLWRLTFADGGDDRLVRMSMYPQDRVDGFLITPAFQ